MQPSDRPDDPTRDAMTSVPAGSGVSRRGFVKGAAATAGIATVATFWFEGMGDPARRRRIEPTRAGAPLQFFTETEFASVLVMVDLLLPSEGPRSPGARDVDAVWYVDAVLANEPIAQNLKDRIRKGVPKAEVWSQKYHQTPFVELDPKRQQIILTQYHRDPEDTRFLRLLIDLTLECFFGDPVHGGNVREIGWKWARHTPGSPRPNTPNWRPRETT